MDSRAILFCISQERHNEGDVGCHNKTISRSFRKKKKIPFSRRR